VATRPARTLTDLLADVGLGPADGDPSTGAAPVIDGLAADLDDAARRAASTGGWTADEPLRLAKGTVGWLLRCPRRALAAREGGMSDDLVAGAVVDAAAKLATLVPQRAPTVDAALAYLDAMGDTSVADHLADRGGPGALPPDLTARIDQLAGAWPAIDPGWWPRVEDPVRAALGGGVVVVSGRLDVLLGGPPTPRPAVIVEVKAGRWHDGARADAHLYALLVALRDGRPPAAVVTVVADGTTQVEPVRPAVLATAADRLVHAMDAAAGIAAGEPAPAHPGPHCTHCPLRPECPEGRSWRPDTTDATPSSP
jgi:PD-(D/E)XK nuclease superfamily